MIRNGRLQRFDTKILISQVFKKSWSDLSIGLRAGVAIPIPMNFWNRKIWYAWFCIIYYIQHWVVYNIWYKVEVTTEWKVFFYNPHGHLMIQNHFLTHAISHRTNGTATSSLQTNDKSSSSSNKNFLSEMAQKTIKCAFKFAKELKEKIDPFSHRNFSLTLLALNFSLFLFIPHSTALKNCLFSQGYSILYIILILFSHFWFDVLFRIFNTLWKS